MQEIGVRAEGPWLGLLSCGPKSPCLSLADWGLLPSFLSGPAELRECYPCLLLQAALMWKDPLGAWHRHGIAVTCPWRACIYFLSSANALTLMRILPSVLISVLVAPSRIPSWPRGGPVNPSWSVKHPLFIHRPLCRVAWRLRRLGFSPMAGLSLSLCFRLWLSIMWDLSSLTRGWISAPCISTLRAWSFNHWTAPEVPTAGLWKHCPLVLAFNISREAWIDNLLKTLAIPSILGGWSMNSSVT